MTPPATIRSATRRLVGPHRAALAPRRPHHPDHRAPRPGAGADAGRDRRAVHRARRPGRDPRAADRWARRRPRTAAGGRRRRRCCTSCPACSSRRRRRFAGFLVGHRRCWASVACWTRDRSRPGTSTPSTASTGRPTSRPAWPSTGRPTAAASRSVPCSADSSRPARGRRRAGARAALPRRRRPRRGLHPLRRPPADGGPARRARAASAPRSWPVPGPCPGRSPARCGCRSPTDPCGWCCCSPRPAASAWWPASCSGPVRFAELAGGSDGGAAVYGVVLALSFGVAAVGAMATPALRRLLRSSTRVTCARAVRAGRRRARRRRRTRPPRRRRCRLRPLLPVATVPRGRC